ncbi:hypothetical protein OROGR_013086 [Orobanche gracilis]
MMTARGVYVIGKDKLHDIYHDTSVIVLAAHRYGVKRVILPERNLKDLVEVPAAVLSKVEIFFAKRMEDVLEQAFQGGCPWRQHSKL